MSVADVGALVQMLTNGFKVGEYRPDDSRDEVEIRARFLSLIELSPEYKI